MIEKMKPRVLQKDQQKWQTFSYIDQEKERILK